MKFLLTAIALSCLIQISCVQNCQYGNYKQFECKNGKCIPTAWLCDGMNDCDDFSDELVDDSMCPCEEDRFKCNNGRCIPNRLACDGTVDCKDGSDEPLEPGRCPLCLNAQFRCNNGHCVPDHLVCNKHDDCGDGSDEPPDCPPCQQIRANHIGKQVLDAPFHNETANMDNTTYFQCANGYCVPAEYVCNHNNDCFDGSDEKQNCPPCPSEMFQCAIGGCISITLVCDQTGITHCNDGSDLENCSRDSSDKTQVPAETTLV